MKLLMYEVIPKSKIKTVDQYAPLFCTVVVEYLCNLNECVKFGFNDKSKGNYSERKRYVGLSYYCINNQI